MKQFLLLLAYFFCLSSCLNRAEKEEKKISSADDIFYDYQVWADEESEDVTVRLQFRRGDKDGDPFAVESPGKVLLDGEELTADSARFTGVYYETAKPVDGFIGKHTVDFIDRSGKKHREEFSFKPFTLVKELPEKIKKAPFQIQLQDFSQTSMPVRLVMVDTSMASADVNEEIWIKNGKVNITEAFLDNLTHGPVMLEIYNEVERPIRNDTADSGRFSMTYGLKRQINLVK
jgi:hypothetical protein